MKTEKRFTEVAILDICLPDFFSGYSWPVVQPVVYPGMTNSELCQAIKEEINLTYEYLTNDHNGYTEDELDMFVKFADDLKKEKQPVIDLPANECECEDECFCDSVYLFLGLCKPVYKYGMQFLNE